MKLLTRSLFVSAAMALAIGCGSEGPTGPAGDAPDIDTEYVEDHENCEAGGTDVLVDGEVSATICDGQQGDPGEAGEDGEDGQDGLTPDVTAERVDEHADCPAGAVVVDVSVDGTSVSETAVCDGEDGEAGASPTITVEDIEDSPIAADCGGAGGYVITVEPADGSADSNTVICNGQDGDVADINITIEAATNCGDAGGSLITIGNEAPFEICNGDEGADGADGDSPSIDVEDLADTAWAGDCGDAGGYLITVTSADGTNTEESVVCNGADGDDAAPAITVEQDPTECDPDGGILLTVGTDSYPICNGSDGADGTGDGGSLDVTIGEDQNCGDAGGYSITIGDEDPIDVCNGDDGADGTDGEDGFSPSVEVEELAPSSTGPCVEGGVKLTITSQDSAGDITSEEVIICGGSEPLPDPVLSWCNTSFPDSIDMTTEESHMVYSHVEIDGYTGDQGGELPASYAAEVGYGDTGVTPGVDWTWMGATLDPDDSFSADNHDSFEAEFSNLPAGDYDFIYRVTIDGSEWNYCGQEGLVDLATYDNTVDAGPMQITLPPEMIVAWTFDGDTLDPSEGVGYAMFSDGDTTDPLGSSTFFGGSSESHWAASGWSQDATFPYDDQVALDDMQYFEFFSDDYSAYTDIELSTTVRRTSTGPAKLLVAGVFSDGELGFLPDPVELPDTSNTDVTLNVSPAELSGDWDATATLESFRIYGYDASGTGNVRILDIDFISP